MSSIQYEILIAPLSEDEGGGYVAIVPDLRGCLSDGETRAEAITNAEDAISQWLSAQEAMGREIPEPGWARIAAEQQDKELLEAVKSAQKLIDQQSKTIKALTKKLQALEERETTLPHILRSDTWSVAREGRNPKPKLVRAN
jgi:antitoxin HicB